MKTHLALSLSLLTALLAACAPTAVTAIPGQPTAVVMMVPSATPLVDVPAPTLAAVTQAPVAETPPAFPIATSRGPNLEATDPRTVSLTSGNIQFVEFFRFT